MFQKDEFLHEINQSTELVETKTNVCELGLSKMDKIKLAELSSQANGKSVTVCYHGSEGCRVLLSAEISLTGEPLSDDQCALIHNLTLELIDNFHDRWERNEGGEGYFELNLLTGEVLLFHTNFITDSDNIDQPETSEQNPLERYASRLTP